MKLCNLLHNNPESNEMLSWQVNPTRRTVAPSNLPTSAWRSLSTLHLMRPLFATSHPSCYPPTSMILNGKYDFNKLHTVTKTITYNLNCMINIYYPISKAHQSNFHHCPISFRIQGLVDTFMALNYMHCSINLTPIYLVGVLVMLLYQWLLKSTDMGSLYWQHSEMMGLNVTSPDYLNIHTWLDPMA